VPFSGGQRNLRFAGENEAKVKRRLEQADRVTETLGGKAMLRAVSEEEKFLWLDRKRANRAKYQTDHSDVQRVDRSKVVARLDF